MRAKPWVITAGVLILLAGAGAVADIVVKQQAQARTETQIEAALDQQLNAKGSTARVSIGSFPVIPQLLKGEVNDIDVDVAIPYATLTKTVQSQLGDGITGVGQSGSGIGVEGQVAALGASVPVEVSFDLSSKGATIILTPASIRIAFVEVSAKDLPKGGDILAQPIEITIDALPTGSEITQIVTGSKGVKATVFVPSYTLPEGSTPFH